MTQIEDLKKGIKSAERDASLIPLGIIFASAGLRWWWTGSLTPERNGELANHLTILALLVVIAAQVTYNRALLLKAELRELLRENGR